MDALGSARWLPRAVSPGSTVRIGQQVQTGTPWPTSPRPSRTPARPGWLEAGSAERTPREVIVVVALAVRREDRRTPGRSHGLAVRSGRSSERDWLLRSGDALSAPVVMPAIPTNGLARSNGIILAVRIIRLRGVSWPGARVSSQYVPNIGIAGTVGNSPAIRMLGHRRTCHTSPTRPTVQLSPVDQMVCPGRGPVDDPQPRSAELLRGREW